MDHRAANGVAACKLDGMRLLSFVFAFISGAFITVQAGSNSQLKKSLGQPILALLVNYIVGSLGVVLYMLLKGERLPSLQKANQVPWRGWTGGLTGALYGLAVVFLASQLGAATLTALVVAGQLICSVLLDHFGWIGFEVHTASLGRVTGCALMVLGFFLIAKF